MVKMGKATRKNPYAFLEQAIGASENEVVLLQTDAETYNETNSEATRLLLEKNYALIYITLNKPSKALSAKFEKEYGKIADEVYFIDGATPAEDVSKTGERNVIHVNPSDLTAMSLAVSKFIAASKKPAALMLDSVEGLLLHNDVTRVGQFSLNLNSKMRLKNLPGVLLSMDQKMDTRLMTVLAQSCDKVIKLPQK